jgi:hypothetical protein
MSIDLALVVLLTVASFLGGLVGQLLGHLLDRRLNQRITPIAAVPLTPPPPPGIDKMATDWARKNGYPDEAARLVADKVRLLHRLSRSRRFRGGR